MVDPYGGAVDSHQPSPASQHVSSGSSGGRRSERIGGSNRDCRSAHSNFDSAPGLRPPMQSIMLTRHT
jgi:hypothetical protein